MSNVPQIFSGWIMEIFQTTKQRAKANLKRKALNCNDFLHNVWSCFVILHHQDGSVLCSWAGWHQCAPPSQLHVLSVLGCDGHQCPPWESFQGVQVQQFLHGSASPHPVPQPVTCCVHYHDPASFLWLWTLQVTTDEQNKSPMSIVRSEQPYIHPRTCWPFRCLQWEGEDVWCDHGDDWSGPSSLHGHTLQLCS